MKYLIFGTIFLSNIVLANESIITCKLYEYSRFPDANAEITGIIKVTAGNLTSIQLRGDRFSSHITSDDKNNLEVFILDSGIKITESQMALKPDRNFHIKAFTADGGSAAVICHPGE